MDRVNPILVFGAGGQVGRELMRAAVPRGLALLGLHQAEADISDREAVLRAVRQHRPAIIINAAAYTAVDKAESDSARAFAVNEVGPRNLAMAANEIGAILVHFSTDYVFDGIKTTAYHEDDPVGPIGIYARSKEAGERAVRESTPRHLILRTAWVYAAHGHNFLRTMLRLAGERDVVRVVADQHGTPTAAADLAKAVLALLPKLALADASFGTFHLTNAGRTTWHGFAQAIFARLAHRGCRTPRVEAIMTVDYPTPARRPEMAVLDCGKIARVYAIHLRAWEEALGETFEQLMAAELQRGEA
jgi:dTDP-4-dehydrorhamnose reductase